MDYFRFLYPANQAEVVEEEGREEMPVSQSIDTNAPSEDDTTLDAPFLWNPNAQQYPIYPGYFVGPTYAEDDMDSMTTGTYLYGNTNPNEDQTSTLAVQPVLPYPSSTFNPFTQPLGVTTYEIPNSNTPFYMNPLFNGVHPQGPPEPRICDKIIRDFLNRDATIQGHSFSGLLHANRRLPTPDPTSRLPPEILQTIFEFAQGVQVSNDTLKLVNIRWHTIMQAPTIWKHITIYVQKRQPVVHPNRLEYLKRSLLLSKKVQLDVTITSDTNNPVIKTEDEDGAGWQEVQYLSADFLALDTVLSLCDMHRWRHLTVDYARVGWLAMLACPNLQSLKIGNTDSLIYGGLCNTIMASAPPLLELDLPAVPIRRGDGGNDNDEDDDTITDMEDENSRAHLMAAYSFANLRSLRAAATQISLSQLPSSLQELHITNDFSKQPPHANIYGLDRIQLPPTFSLPWCSTRILQRLHLERIQHLTIQELRGNLSGPDTSIPCPALQTLIVPAYDLTSLLYITAPDLHELHIGTTLASMDASKYRLSSLPDTMILLRDLPHHLKLAPRVLKMRIPLTADAILLLLENWRRLEQVSIRIAKPFQSVILVKGLIKNRFIRETTIWTCGPRLKWLKLVVDGAVGKGDVWSQYARTILDGRRESLLDCVSWSYEDGKETVLCRGNL
ncbi:hypothetical protein M408DRAFT_329884 [Serendipita vermifera MAFF 305830]|uniref:F-box domain-containing protein n=1 Tax=Serendipita vermifera MAFF 305830 TaxID=933852 RepID=A0A0C2WN76_SERVB|nr:hypothetical protein M408DRAFT_329884 [Serendipita vermifera MAFF 305830]